MLTPRTNASIILATIVTLGAIASVAFIGFFALGFSAFLAVIARTL